MSAAAPESVTAAARGGSGVRLDLEVKLAGEGLDGLQRIRVGVVVAAIFSPAHAHRTSGAAAATIDLERFFAGNDHRDSDLGARARGLDVNGFSGRSFFAAGKHDARLLRDVRGGSLFWRFSLGGFCHCVSFFLPRQDSEMLCEKPEPDEFESYLMLRKFHARVFALFREEETPANLHQGRRDPGIAVGPSRRRVKEQESRRGRPAISTVR